MQTQNERLAGLGKVPRWVVYEHLARYEFASAFVRDRVVIDCACGAGIGSRRFAASGARQVEAFDSAADSFAKPPATSDLGNLRFRVASALQLPMPDRSADTYISLETIEHLDDDRAFLAEVRRVLKPDGVFVCSTPDRTVTNPGKHLSDRVWNRFHLREYARSEFVALLQTAFGEVEMHGQNPQSPAWVRLLGVAGSVVPLHGAVRFNQALKAPRLFTAKPEHHVVMPEQGRIFEYLVAVCRRPK
jgi:SAM-dependent methyltransferase